MNSTEMDSTIPTVGRREKWCEQQRPHSLLVSRLALDGSQIHMEAALIRKCRFDTILQRYLEELREHLLRPNPQTLP